jgi:hypothetical protein
MRSLRTLPIMILLLSSWIFTGCYNSGGNSGGNNAGFGQVNNPNHLWFIGALVFGIIVCCGVFVALSTPKEDSERRGMGLMIAAGAAVLAIVCIA